MTGESYHCAEGFGKKGHAMLLILPRQPDGCAHTIVPPGAEARFFVGQIPARLKPCPDTKLPKDPNINCVRLGSFFRMWFIINNLGFVFEYINLVRPRWIRKRDFAIDANPISLPAAACHTRSCAAQVPASWAKSNAKDSSIAIMYYIANTVN